MSVSETIAEAGLSNQAFYRHFQGKDEFLLAILDDGLRQLLIYLEHEMALANPRSTRSANGFRSSSPSRSVPRRAEPTRAVPREQQPPALLAPRRVPSLRGAHRTATAAGARRRSAAGVLRPLDLDRDIRAIYRLTMGSMEVSFARSQPPSDKTWSTSFA